jgi:hypothetical protein
LGRQGGKIRIKAPGNPLVEKNRGKVVSGKFQFFQEDNFGKEKPYATAVYIRYEVFERVPPVNPKG